MGTSIKVARIMAGYDKAYVFAKEMGISRQYLTMLENGRANNPSRELMLKMSKALGISVQELFFSKEQ